MTPKPRPLADRLASYARRVVGAYTQGVPFPEALLPSAFGSRRVRDLDEAVAAPARDAARHDDGAAPLIAAWLAGDAALAPLARRLAEGNEFEYGDDELSLWADDLLYDPLYGTGRLADLQWVADEGGDVEAARAFREEITEARFDRANWADVRLLLLEGEEA